MNGIIGRLKNAYETDGIKEVFRKAFWKSVYIKNGIRIKKDLREKQLEYGLCKPNTRQYQVIVSLTTFPKRFSYIEDCLKSLVVQNEKPDKIIVYLGSDSVGIELPAQMKLFEEYGVEFRYDEKEDLRSHKKYFYAMQEFPEAVVVTADDDIIYPSNWLTSLLQSYEKYPNCISARRVHLMLKGSEGHLREYNHWIDQCRKEPGPSNALIATGNAGILYPPHCLDERAFDVEKIKKYCFAADDIWLKCMALLKGTKYVWVPNNEVDLPEIKDCQSTGLNKLNVVQNMNDVYFAKMCQVYGIEVDAFFEKQGGKESV